MRRLPLYEEPPQGALMEIDGVARDAECKRCSLHEKTRTVCMPAEGKPGGLLVVGERPGKIEDQLGRPMSDGVGKYLRAQIARWWSGPIALDNAVRCPGGSDIEEEHIDACRGFGRTVFNQTRPKRILAIGNAAVLSVLGRRPPLIYARRGYSFIYDELDDPIPVFLLVTPAYALRNRFEKEQFEADLQWALTADPPEPDWGVATFLVESAADAHEAAEEIGAWGSFTYDVETSGRMPNRDFLIESLTVMPTWEDGDGFTWTREAMADPAACAPLKSLFADPKLLKTTQNGKYDDRSVMTYKLLKQNVAGVEYDTRLMRKLLEPESAASLDVLAWLVGLGGHKGEAQEANDAILKELKRLANPPSALTPKGKPRKIRPPAFHVEPGHLKQIAAGTDAEAFMFHYMDPTTLYRYNARDVHVTRSDARVFVRRIKERPALVNVWKELTKPASIAVRHIEHWGIACDRQAVLNLASYCQGKIAAAQQKIELHKPGMNPNSYKQVGSYLYDELGLKSTKETKSGGRSTNDEALAPLRNKHPVVAAILESRKYTKLNGTYALGMLRHIQEDGRIHPSFLIDGTETGRYSCSDPSLHGLPRAEEDANNAETHDAAMARNCFVAPDGFVLLELDYSQIELRVAAILSGDKVMMADFASGIDIHMNNATLSCMAAFGITRAKWDAMSKEQRKPFRSKIKNATFAKLYGKRVHTLAKEWGAPLAEVEAIDKAIWGRYSRLDAWTQEQIARTRKLGYVETWWDGKPAMRRHLPKIGDADEYVRRHAENAAVNTPVQGTAAHYMSASLPKVVDYVISEALPAKVVLTVHDSLMLEVRERDLSEIAHECRRIMRSHNSAGVVIDVEAKYGPAYGSMQEFKFQ